MCKAAQAKFQSFCFSPCGVVRSMRMCIICVAVLLLPACGGNVISHRVHVLRPASCARNARVRRGDDVSMRLSALRVGGKEFVMSNGYAEQRHVVGKHPVPPINKAVIGMCKGEQRQVSVYWDGDLGAQYFIELVDIWPGSRQLKPATNV